MPVDLHLFSTPGDNIRYVIEASRPYLEDKDDPIVAYMPLASLYAEKWLDDNERAFKGLARLESINAELMTQKGDRRDHPSRVIGLYSGWKYISAQSSFACQRRNAFFEKENSIGFAVGWIQRRVRSFAGLIFSLPMI